MYTAGAGPDVLASRRDAAACSSRSRESTARARRPRRGCSCEALGEDALAVREPGGTAVGERVRELLKDPGVEIEARAEALLFAAARAELVAEVIRPALDEGRMVVSDRFLDSSLAYQGGARGLGVDEVARVNEWATGGLRPDLTSCSSCPPTPRHARRRGRPLRARGRRASGARARRLRAARGADPGRWRRSTRTARRTRSTRDVLGVGRGSARGSADEPATLPGTEDHPHARMVLGSALESGSPSHAYLFHGPRRHGQARGGAGARRRAAGRGRRPTPTTCRRARRARLAPRPDLGGADAART